MGKKTRVRSKIGDLPENIRCHVDVMLADMSNKYSDISLYLKEEGFEVSKSAVGRYAMRTNAAAQRLLAAQMQTDRLMQLVKENPNADYTEAPVQLMMHGLTQKIATAEEEFDELPLDKAGRLIASLSRTKTYKDRVRQYMLSKAEIAFREMEADIMKMIKQDEESVQMLKTILSRARERMMQDD